MPIYILTLSKIAPGEPTGSIGDLFEDAYSNVEDAERAFKKLQIGPLYFRKELWQKTTDGRRILIKEERYAANKT